MDTTVLVAIVSSASGLVGVALGAFLQPWLSARFERRRFSWEQRRALLPRIRKLQEEASSFQVDWVSFSHAYIDFGTEMSVWFHDRLLQICHNWIAELIDKECYKREQIRGLLLVIEVVLSSRLAVEAGTRWRPAFTWKRHQMKKHLQNETKKALEHRSLPDKYEW